MADMTSPIVIDCDPGHDDAFALMLAVASPELDLVGVTTVAGNQTLEKTTANALTWALYLLGRAPATSLHMSTVRPGSTDPTSHHRRASRSISTRSTSWRG